MNTVGARIYRLLLIATLLGAGGSLRAQAQQPEPPLVVARLFIDVEGLEADFPDKANGWLPVFIEAVRAVAHAQEVVDALRDPDASPVKIALDSIYAVIEAGLRERLARDILPLDTLRGAVPYVFGYPMGSPTKVVRTGAYGGALGIEVYVTVPDQAQSSYSIFSTGKARVKGRPEMALSVRLVGSDGNEVWKEKVRVRAKEKVVLDEYWVLGIRKETRAPDAGSLPDLTRRAMTAFLQKIPAS